MIDEGPDYTEYLERSAQPEEPFRTEPEDDPGYDDRTIPSRIRLEAIRATLPELLTDDLRELSRALADELAEREPAPAGQRKLDLTGVFVSGRRRT